MQTIDDLIEYFDEMAEILTTIRNECNLDSSREFFGGQYVGYLDARKKTEELKANMEKKTFLNITFSESNRSFINHVCSECGEIPKRTCYISHNKNYCPKCYKNMEKQND